MTSQKISGEATTPITRLFWRQKRTSSRCQRVAAGRIKLFNGCSRFAYEDVFEGGFVKAHRFNGTWKGLHHFGDEAVAVLNLDAKVAVHHHGVQSETFPDALG